MRCTDSHAVYAFSITCTCCANFSKISWGERVEFIQSDKVRSVKSEFRKFSGCSNTICHRREHVNVTGKDKDLSPLRMHVAKGQVAPKWDPLHTAYPNSTPGLGLPFFFTRVSCQVQWGRTSTGWRRRVLQRNHPTQNLLNICAQLVNISTTFRLARLNWMEWVVGSAFGASSWYPSRRTLKRVLVPFCSWTFQFDCQTKGVKRVQEQVGAPRWLKVIKVFSQVATQNWKVGSHRKRADGRGNCREKLTAAANDIQFVENVF